MLMQDMTPIPKGMVMVRRCLCVKDVVNNLVDAMLFTAHIYRVAREVTDVENLIALQMLPFVEKLESCCGFQHSL